MAISALVRRDIATQISQSKLVKKRASTDLPMHSLSRYSQIRVATQYMYISVLKKQMWFCTMLMVNVMKWLLYIVVSCILCCISCNGNTFGLFSFCLLDSSNYVKSLIWRKLEKKPTNYLTWEKKIQIYKREMRTGWMVHECMYVCIKTINK